MHNRYLSWIDRYFCAEDTRLHHFVCDTRAEESMFVRHSFSESLGVPAKLALFDLDDTLIKSEVHHKNNGTKWVFLYKSVPERLHELYMSGFFVGIISNQFGLDVFKESFVAMLDEFLSRFEFPIFFIATTKNDFFRKPLPGSYLYLRHKYFRKVDASSFYVGDAAGRSTGAVRDHSCCDIKFAYNCCLKFFTPEAFFRNEPNTTTFFMFNPRQHTTPVILGDSRDIVVVFGKGHHSGKTFFLNKHFPGHQIVRGGNLRTQLPRSAFLDVQQFSELTYLIKKNGTHNVQCIFLDYGTHVLHYIRTFSKMTGKQSMHVYRSHELGSLLCSHGCGGKGALKTLFLEKFDTDLTIVDFCFDDSKYDETEMLVSRFQL
eukprot:jgi/Antlo1/806/214